MPSTNTPPPLPSASSRFDFVAMENPPGLASVLDAVLKKPGRIIHGLQQPGGGRIVAILALVSVVCLAIYGAVAGSLSGGIQLWAAPAKIILGMTASAIICLPSLYIFTCLNGAEANLRGIAGALAAAVCLVSLLLVGFAPVVWVFSQSTDSVAFMGSLNLIFFAIGAFFGLPVVTATNRFFGATEKGHVKVWALVFLIVCLQMTTALRPIIGTSDTLLPTEKRFFLVHWLDAMAASPPGR